MLEIYQQALSKVDDVLNAFRANSASDAALYFYLQKAYDRNRV